MSTDANEVLACKLSEAQKEDRRPKVEALFVERLKGWRETDDGYAFEFDAETENLRRVFEFVEAERKCCPFFRFDVTIEREEGPLWLEIGGPEHVKQFVADNVLEEIDRLSEG